LYDSAEPETRFSLYFFGFTGGCVIDHI